MAKQNEKEAQSKSLNHAIRNITKEFGKGSIMKMSDRPLTVPTFSSGSLALDHALGKGVPEGRIIEIYGAESSGKTTTALEMTASVQHRGGVVAYIDAENALDPSYARNLGVNIDDLLLSQPDTGEQGLQIADALVKSSAVDLIVIDSVAALVPRQEIEGSMGDAHVGLQARMMSQALRSFSGELSRTNTTMLFINQLREKVGVMFGNPETTPGGRALKFYASQRIKINRGQKIKQGQNVIGNHAKFKVTKNKVAPPFRRCTVDIMYGTGFSKEGELLDMGNKIGAVKKAGAWYSYGTTRIGQGRENAKKWLQQHPKVEAVLDLKIRLGYKMIDQNTYDKAMKKLQQPSSESTDHKKSPKTNSKKTSKKSTKSNKKA